MLATNGDVAGTTWQVERDEQAVGGLVLALTENYAARGQLNLCVAPGAIRDVDFSVRCKGDYGVGIVWRCRDGNNYYVLRVNPMEGNVNLYVVANGTRSRLASAQLGRFEDEQWRRLRVRHVGQRIEAWLDDERLYQAVDATHGEAGSIGVWTRADALGRFGDFVLREVRGSS
ncbi:MAG: hypothetical protein CHACPFDD_03524 [Phycisphaerae bacterium]|nr:hypothetical protein [Phycisphaerae bacterium]